LQFNFNTYKMKNLLFIFAACILASCNQSSTNTEENTQATSDTLNAEPMAQNIADNSKNSLDWSGTYVGSLPCADCEGIDATVEINQDNTFKTNLVYKGKKSKPFTESGTFTWNEEGSKIYCVAGSDTSVYLVGENQLIQLDKEGNRIIGPLADNYIFKKKGTNETSALPITGTKWILEEINNTKPKAAEDNKPMFLELDAAKNRFIASMGCNTIFGGYELTENNTIKFGEGASTMMACPNMETEATFGKLLPTISTYQLAENKLSLLAGKKVVLVFSAGK